MLGVLLAMLEMLPGALAAKSGTLVRVPDGDPQLSKKQRVPLYLLLVMLGVLLAMLEVGRGLSSKIWHPRQGAGWGPPTFQKNKRRHPGLAGDAGGVAGDAGGVEGPFQANDGDSPCGPQDFKLHLFIYIYIIYVYMCISTCRPIYVSLGCFFTSCIIGNPFE